MNIETISKFEESHAFYNHMHNIEMDPYHEHLIYEMMHNQQFSIRHSCRQYPNYRVFKPQQQNLVNLSLDENRIYSPNINPSNSNQVPKNSHERVYEYIEKGNQLRIRNPSIIKPQTFKPSLELIKQSGCYYIPEKPRSNHIGMTLPPIEKLPEDEELGGYIFMANKDTLIEQMQSKVFSKLGFTHFFNIKFLT